MPSNKVTTNFLWRFMERCGAQGVSFVVSIILARLLAPDDYGTIALVTVFTNILSVFIDCGFGTALIQKKDVDDLDFSTVFFFNVAVCSLLYILLFVFAPMISGFYKRPELTPLVRVLSLTILIAGVKNIQQAYVSRNMIFKRFFFATLGGTITAACLGIYMAYKGFGPWALVTQQLVNAAIDTVILWITVKWRPKWMFSFERLKSLFKFASNLLLSEILNTVYNNLRSLIIGRMYSSKDLAFYNKGQTFPSLIVNNITVSIDSVLMPSMAQHQDNISTLRMLVRRAIKVSVYLMAPLMMGLAFTSHSVIKLLLTEKWLPCVPYLCIICITYMFYPIHSSNLNAVKAMGRSDIFLKLEIAKKIVGLIALGVSMWFGVMAMAYSLLFTSVASQIINSWPNKKLLSYGYLSQLKDILPAILLAVFMGMCVQPISLLPLPLIVTLAIQVIVGAGIYIAGSKIFKFEAFDFCLSTAKSFIKKRRG